jgi:EAL domain-containing protein (putative c-di-GMP-specific phosphodiesterase class I)/predicted transcriptional regulator
VTHAFQATMEQENKRQQQRVNFFDSKLQVEMKRQLLLEDVVSEAIDDNNVDIVYQPIVNCHSWEIEGYEVLSRFKCDSALKTSNRELIDVIEDLNLISELDLLTYHKALVELDEVIKNSNVFIDINVSANTRQDFSELFDCINLLTTQFKLDHARLVIDINPPKDISEIENCISHFAKLTSKGTSMALAALPFGFDLGAQLERGHFNFLRIDEQFFHKFHEEKEYYQVVKLLISLCHDVNIQVIVEGVDSVDQAQVLASLGVDYLQGNVFTLPVDIHGIAELSDKIEATANLIFKDSSLYEDEKEGILTTTIGSIASHGLPSLEPRDTISLANEYFKTQTVSVLPVIVDKKCVGVIDRALLSLHLTPTMGTDLETEKESRVWQRRVNFFMNVEFNSVEATLDIQSLLNLIGDKRYQLPLVLTKRGLYSGILTERNLMDYLLRKMA